MNAIIIEDEPVAAERLKKMISSSDAEIEILAVYDNVLDSANYLRKNHPDLIFMDVHLSDGLCFELFEQLQIDASIIFTTAYDEYMQAAFKVNSIDYLLKPIKAEELNASLNKFKKYRTELPDRALLKKLFEEYIRQNNAYKCRFMVRSGRGYISLDVADIAYVYSENRLNQLITMTGKKYAVDYSLDQLVEMLNPRRFIKINRNYIISNQSITRIEPYFNNRMLVNLTPTPKSEVLVSRNYLRQFKQWMEM